MADGRPVLTASSILAMSPWLGATSSGRPSSTSSVVPMIVWPRQGSTKKCPLPTNMASAPSSVSLRVMRWMPLARTRRCEGGPSWASAITMSAQGPAALIVTRALKVRSVPLRTQRTRAPVTAPEASLVSASASA